MSQPAVTPALPILLLKFRRALERRVLSATCVIWRGLPGYSVPDPRLPR